MDELRLEDIAQRLSDLELATFLSLVASEHCLIETTGDSVNDVAKELALISTHTFGLSYSVLDCGWSTSMEDIHQEILTAEARKHHTRPAYLRTKTETSSNRSSYMNARDRSKSPIPGSHPSENNVVNIVIAKNFNLVDEDVQVQILQLMRARKLATEVGILNAPQDFVFVPVVVRESDQLKPPLKTHLNEHLFISHFHGLKDGYVYLEESEWLSDGQQSASSVINSPKKPQKKSTSVDQVALDKLREASDRVATSAEVVRYIQDIVVFLRLSRAVAGGVSAKANNQFNRLAKLLAPLHGIDYLTPSIVALAARKLFRHRIVVASPEDDRSLQYGSDIATVSRVLAGVTPDSILDGVLALEPPL
ncbi:hypothetical protein N7492_010471 [Penicillium capsulatum]|uniref:magnesium chelatase n=1 Tax=Penicillium capsulatum TaxID=69766 RepID=A0A9W9HPR7_9EURO|nr:hypothetical protein N7492_010471 [Penicillium capsulatum]KAJ6112974.1 hypothetical protein N7512_008298 [Penicillium capsulatum]